MSTSAQPGARALTSCDPPDVSRTNCEDARMPTGGSTFSGELQSQVMAALWRLQSATVNDVRETLAPEQQSAYTTVQTVLNRLAERGLVDRAREGRQFVYSPRLSEADYVSGSVRSLLDRASPETRRAVLSELAGSLEDDAPRGRSRNSG